MDWESVSNDEIEEGLGQFFGVSAAGLAEACLWLREADRRQQFLADGSPNMTQWLSARYGVRHSTAKRLVDTARRLQSLPVLSKRFGEGVLSFDQVEAVSKLATPTSEETLVEEALGMSNTALDRAARRANPPTSEEERSVWERRELYVQNNLDQSEGRLTARMPGAEIEIVANAISERADQMPVNPETGVHDSYPARMADGLVELCATSGDTTTRPTAQVTIHADLQTLVETTGGVAELETGPVITNQTTQRLGCDCIIETTVYDHNQILGVGRRTRTIPRWLLRQLDHRDRGCRFPGCGNTRWVQAHHILYWSLGGPTDLNNLILLCGYHHRFLHEHGWKITGNPNRQVQFHKPDGQAYPPPRPDLHPRLKTLVRTT